MKNIGRKIQIPDQSFFLFGPRGTGKSTLVKQLFPNALYIDFLLPNYYRELSARPETLLEMIDSRPEVKIIVLDEIQKVPELLSVVHRLIEEKRGLQFILTGSSARKLKRSGTNLLAGRALMRHLHPFTAAELGPLFNLEKALDFGLVPIVLAAENPADSLKAYLDLYIREEVQMEGLTRNIGNFSRFLEVISFSHASILNFSNIARECQLGRKTIESYVSILEDLLLAFSLPVFAKRAKRKLASHPKFYLFDVGIYKSLRPRGPLDQPQILAGAALEGLVAQQLRAWIDYGNSDCQLFFWRTQSGSEVDFIVYGNNCFWAIEVKNSKSVQHKDLRALKAFGADYPEAKRILLYRGKEKLMRDGILIRPCQEFLLELS
ncbi:MAG: ATP-binding protein [Candidatus Margulisiibacteriota bacterium]